MAWHDANQLLAVKDRESAGKGERTMKKLVHLLMAVIWMVPLLLSAARIASAEGRIGVIVVDVQGDFTTWKNGSLAVAGTDEAFIRKVRDATRHLARAGFPIFATQDWHPANHVSFYTNHPGKKPFEAIQIEGRTQILWPPHCVQGTENAKVLLKDSLFWAVVRKGQDPQYDSYSGFQDDGGKKTEMDSLLRRHNITKVVVYGIATDYCVKATALDALAGGYRVLVVEGLCKGVAPDTSAGAWQEMKEKGVKLIKELDIAKIIDM
jgi:nicotinamidase/pyrazinamidase